MICGHCGATIKNTEPAKACRAHARDVGPHGVCAACVSAPLDGKRARFTAEFENPRGEWAIRPTTETIPTRVTGPLSRAMLIAACIAHETKADAEPGSVASVTVLVIDAFGGAAFKVVV